MADETSDKIDPGIWRLEAAGLQMRADATEAGKLVLLADVVRWLMRSRELPLIPAVKALCEKLKSINPPPQLYHAGATNWARPMRADNDFGYFTQAKLDEARRLVQRVAAGDIEPMHPFSLKERAPSAFGVPAHPVTRATAENDLAILDRMYVVEPGLPAAVLYIMENWHVDVDWWSYLKGHLRRYDDLRNALDDPKLRTHSLCMRLQDAMKHFGFGITSDAELTTFEQVASHRRGNKGAPWVQSHWNIVLTEIMHRGGPGTQGVVGAVADRLGMTVRGLNDRLKRHPASTEVPGASELKSVSNLNDPFRRAGRKASGR